MNKPNVFIVCTGVGHINRGYESFTVECFNALKSSDEFELYLLKGGGSTVGKELKLSCIKRRSKLGSFLFKTTGRQAYWFEQFTFFISMLPKLIKYKPAVIFYSDFVLGTFLWHLRRFLKFKYKLLFSNGAPNGPPYKTEDHVQQLLDVYLQLAIEQGTPPEKQTLLPYGFDIADKPQFFTDEEKVLTRKYLGLPTDKKVIISVGAINTGHKRMDYVIREFAKLNTNEYYLLLLGQIDHISDPVINLASELLPPNSYAIKQVSSTEVTKYLNVSDYFILASLTEGFGRVLIEAQQYGLLPIVHDYNVVHEVLKGFAVYADLRKDNLLQSLINKVDESGLSKEEIWRYAFDSYSWYKLKDRYTEMIVKNIS